MAAYCSGEGPYAVIAARFGVGEASVKRWVWRHRDHGHLEPNRKGGGTPSSIGAADIERLLDELRDATANELTAAYNRSRRGRDRVHVSSIKRALHRHGYTVKKNAAGRLECLRPRRPEQASRLPKNSHRHVVPSRIAQRKRPCALCRATEVNVRRLPGP